MTRIGQLATALLFIGQVATAQSPNTYPSPFQSVPITQLAHQNVSVFNAYRINSSGFEFSPSYYMDGIVYVSGQQDFQKNQKQPTSFFELLHATFDADGMPGNPQPFSTHVNNQLHEGQASFNAAGTLVYYTSNSEVKSVEGDYSMKIYEARKEDNDWAHIVDLPFNSEAYSNQHPSISADGTTLYFASNMPGGYGGTDIYMVEKEGVNWGIPKNLGDQINTSENDAFPFIHATDYLFFASQGHGGEGDYDIFVVNIAGGLPGPLLHLDAPFNSPQADIGFIMEPSSTKGFFASDRIGGSGRDDIYLFEAPLGVLHHTKQTTSKQAMPSKKKIVQTVAAPTKAPVEEKKKQAIAATVPAEQIVQKKAEETQNKIKESNPTIEKKQAIATTVPAEKIAQKKVAETQNKIKESNTAIERKQAIATTTPPKKIIPQKTLHPQRRRTKPIKKEVEKQQQTTATPSPKIVPKQEEQPAQKTTPAPSTLKEKMATATTYRTMPTQKTLPVKKQIVNDKPSSSKQLTIGSSIELKPIYYDLKNGTIRSVDAVQLNSLIRLLKQYPSIELELIEHTDARGTSFYNQQLSQTRAVIAKNYIVNQGGIAPHRVGAVGRGESQLRNHCQDNVVCSDEEHQYNRRIEVRITRMREAGQVWFEMVK